jgi:hypothetical protein
MGLLDAKSVTIESRKLAARAVSSPHLPLNNREALASPPIARSPEMRPNPARAGLVVFEPGRPFSHYCEICGAWGSFGYGHLNFRTGKLGRWFCFEHKPEFLV